LFALFFRVSKIWELEAEVVAKGTESCSMPLAPKNHNLLNKKLAF